MHIQVACGNKFTYAITDIGEIISFGDCWEGQLGRGDFLKVSMPDTTLKSIQYFPIINVSCGKSHVILLSVSGEVFTCGSNQFGQLGQGDTQKRVRPTLVHSLLNKGITSITAGGDHCLAITDKGRLFSWGSGSFGQLGHGDTIHHLSPTFVSFFTQYQVKSISAGSRHSIAIAMLSNSAIHQVFSWGCGASGQLGHGNTQTIHSPKVISGHWDDAVPVSISCGYEFTFVSVADSINEKQPQERPYKGLQYFDYKYIFSLGQSNIALLQAKIQHIFSSVPALNASFLDHDENSKNYHLRASEEHSGIDLASVRRAFTYLIRLYDEHPPLLISLANATSKLVRSLKEDKFELLSQSQLRVFLILPEVPWMVNPEKYQTVLEQFVTAIIGLSNKSKAILQTWWENMPSEYFIRQVDVFKFYLTYLIDKSSNLGIISSVVFILDILHQANLKSKRIPYTHFYQPIITRNIDLFQDYQNWISSTRVFNFCSFPFLLEPEAKLKLLEIEATVQMKLEFCKAILLNTEPFFTIHVSRENLFASVYNELINYIELASDFPRSNLKKPLKVHFIGEDGIDAGGLKRELFSLLLDEIINPERKLFVTDEETNLLWFPTIEEEASKELLVNYTLVGMIIGIAIYNGIILNVNFPSVVFRMLLDGEPTIADLHNFRPQLARSILQLGELSEEDIADADLTFTVHEKELILGGRNIPVTKNNVNQFIDLYIKYHLKTSIEKQFKAFYNGFWAPCSGKVLKTCNPQELELMICGSADLDFDKLKAVTVYLNYTESSPVIRWFWEIVNNYSHEEKRKFLFFVTGTRYAPPLGLSHMKFGIQRSGPHSDLLPVSHTCVNLLDLPVTIFYFSSLHRCS